MPDQWPRALLRAGLREAGYDAIGTRGLRAALSIKPTVPERGPVGLIIVDQPALAATATASLAALRSRHADVKLMLIARPTVATPASDWNLVLRRPLSVADIVTAAQSVLPLAPNEQHALD